MRNSQLLGLFAGMLVDASVNAAAPFALPSEDRIQPSSLELERKTQPWCPGDCAVGVSFVASYRRGAERLVFIGAHHAFRPNAPTMRAVDEGFAEIQPNIVIVEGFPTAMGENPPPLLAEAHRYGAPDADEYARGEAMYAASIALMRMIPFIGGEPSREEENQVLLAKGFTDADMAFSGLLGGLSQALRSGEIPDTSRESLAKIYPRLAEQLKLPLDHGGWNLDAPSMDEFRQRYRDIYGVDLEGDHELPQRRWSGSCSSLSLRITSIRVQQRKIWKSMTCICADATPLIAMKVKWLADAFGTVLIGVVMWFLTDRLLSSLSGKANL